MKTWKNLAIGAAVAALAGPVLAQNTGAALTDGDATWNTKNSSSGTAAGALPTSPTTTTIPGADFNIAGVPGGDNAFSGWWYYRLNSETRENSFNNAVSRTLTGTNIVQWGFNNVGGINGLAATLEIALFDTGTDSALNRQSLVLTNGSAAPVSVDLFAAYDFDLSGTFGGDVVGPLDVQSNYRRWNVTEAASANGGNPWTLVATGYGASGAGAGGFSAVNTQLTDTNLDNFIPDLNAGGLIAGDYAEVFQWRATLNPGDSLSSVATYNIGRNGVPEPTTALLLLVGLVPLLRRR